MRGSVLGSGLAHVLIVVVLFIVRQPVSIVVPGPDVMQVALMDPSALTTPPPPAPPEPPTVKPDDVKPVEDTGVKLQPQPPKKKKDEPPPKRPSKSEPAPALPSAPAG